MNRPVFPGCQGPYGVLTPGYQDLTADAVFCPYRGVRLDPFSRGCETYGLFATIYQDSTADAVFCPYGASPRVFFVYTVSDASAPVSYSGRHTRGGVFIGRR